MFIANNILDVRFGIKNVGCCKFICKQRGHTTLK